MKLGFCSLTKIVKVILILLMSFFVISVSQYLFIYYHLQDTLLSYQISKEAMNLLERIIRFNIIFSLGFIFIGFVFIVVLYIVEKNKTKSIHENVVEKIKSLNLSSMIKEEVSINRGYKNGKHKVSA